MSEILPFDKDCIDRALKILVVGYDKMIGPLSASILDENKTSNIIFKLKVHKCENLKQVLSPKRSPPHVDYIVLCLPSNSPKYIKQIEEDISRLSKIFLLGRICLVLGLYGSVSDSDTTSIMELRQKYQLHVLNSKINEKECCRELSRRILRLIAFTCGLYTGYCHIEYNNYYSEKRDESVSSGFSSSF